MWDCGPGRCQLTHLSRSTTPSMQAPKSTTLLKSVVPSRKAHCHLRPLLSPEPTPVYCVCGGWAGNDFGGVLPKGCLGNMGRTCPG